MDMNTDLLSAMCDWLTRRGVVGGYCVEDDVLVTAEGEPVVLAWEFMWLLLKHSTRLEKLTMAAVLKSSMPHRGPAHSTSVIADCMDWDLDQLWAAFRQVCLDELSGNSGEFECPGSGGNLESSGTNNCG